MLYGYNGKKDDKEEYRVVCRGQSPYYIAENNLREQAVFHARNPYHPISYWWGKIYDHGLIKGESEYYIAEHQRFPKQAIFHVKFPREPVSQWWAQIYYHGLVNGTSEYYIAQEGIEDAKQAIFSKYDKEPITPWLNRIWTVGVVNGTNQYYATTSQDGYIQVYNIKDPSFCVYEIPYETADIVLHVDEKIAVYIRGDSLLLYDTATMYEETLMQVPDNLQRMIQQSKQSNKDLYIHQTDMLINEYKQFDLVPVVIENKYFVFDLNTAQTHSFVTESAMTKYLATQKIDKDDENKNNTDIIVLY